MNELRFAFRQVLKNPGFTAAAVLILAVGMAANTTVFSLIQTALFQPLAVRDPDQLAAVMIPGTSRQFSAENFRMFKAQQAVFQGVAAYAPDRVLCRVGKQQSRLPVELVSTNYFAFLGLKSAAGRLLGATDAHAPNLVISARWWARQFNSEPTIIGQVVHVSGRPFTVVGVAPPGFGGMTMAAPVDAWIATGMRHAILHGATTDPRARWLLVVVRVKPGVSLAAAQTLVRGLERKVMEPWMFTGTPKHLELAPCGRGLLPPDGQSVGRLIAVFLFSVMALVLIVACTNLAGLLLCRGISRRRELAVRLALGASRKRVVQQLLLETLVVSLLGGALGLLLSTWGVKLLAAAVPSVLGRLSFNLAFSFDPRVVAYTLALSVITTLACGLVPALRSTQPELQSALKNETQGLTVRTRWHDLRNLLVVTQVTVCVVLLAGGGLMLRSLGSLEKTKVGFDYRHCLAAPVWNRDHSTPRAEYVQRLAELVNAARALPGVREACLCTHPPFSEDMAGTSVTPEENRSHWAMVMCSVVSSDFFRTLRIPILQGRDFTPADNTNSDRVVIINRELQQELWPHQAPLGRRLYFGNAAYTVVGVAGNAFSWKIGAQDQAGLYFCFEQNPPTFSNGPRLLVRVNGSVRPLLGLVADLVRRFDPGHQAPLVEPYAEFMVAAFLPQRATAWVLSLASVAALGLVSIGLYGVLGYYVAQRTREIGLRIALGARRGQVLGAMLRRGLALTGVGLVAGLGLSLVAARLLAALLYKVRPADPLTLVTVSLLIPALTLAACFFPARRAANVDPMEALRYE
jgi:putative ABC transport system permease protein